MNSGMELRTPLHPRREYGDPYSTQDGSMGIHTPPKMAVHPRREYGEYGDPYSTQDGRMGLWGSKLHPRREYGDPYSTQDGRMGLHACVRTKRCTGTSETFDSRVSVADRLSIFYLWFPGQRPNHVMISPKTGVWRQKTAVWVSILHSRRSMERHTRLKTAVSPKTRE